MWEHPARSYTRPTRVLTPEGSQTSIIVADFRDQSGARCPLRRQGIALDAHNRRSTHAHSHLHGDGTCPSGSSRLTPPPCFVALVVLLPLLLERHARAPPTLPGRAMRVRVHAAAATVGDRQGCSLRPKVL